MTYFETMCGRTGGERGGEFVAGNFERGAAFLADQELARVRLAGLAAREKCVLRRDSVHEAVLNEKVERAIDGRGRHAAAALRLDGVDQVVGADRLARPHDEFVDLPAQRREREAAFCGKRFCTGEHLFG